LWELYEIFCLEVLKQGSEKYTQELILKQIFFDKQGYRGNFSFNTSLMLVSSQGCEKCKKNKKTVK
jgi:hypothetical protein